jgi:hypothetical protein
MIRTIPIPVGQRVLIQPRRRRFKAVPSLLGIVRAIPGPAHKNGWVYYVKRDDGILGTFSDKQLTPITALDEIARAC